MTSAVQDFPHSPVRMAEVSEEGLSPQGMIAKTFTRTSSNESQGKAGVQET